MPGTPGPVGNAGPLKRELLALVGLVLLADACFIAAYFLFHLAARADSVRLGFTAVWTLVTLAIVVRGLIRIRAVRGRTGRTPR